MKILSYNINGLKHFTTSGRFTDLLNDYRADIYCFQEVKVQDPVLQSKLINECATPLNIASSSNKEKSGYAGVLTMFAFDMNNLESPVEEKVFEASDTTKQQYMGGRVIVTEFKDYYLINVYVPNSGGGKEQARQDWDKQFCEYVKSLNKPVIICGDMNVCATELDFWNNWQKARNTYPGLMQFEIDGFAKLCEECNLVDAYRFVNGDKREYTWFPPNRKAIDANHGWKLDYFLVSDSLKDRIKSCTIADRYQTPDHQPIILDIE